MKKRQDKEKKSGKKTPGRIPSSPTLEIKGSDQINLIDEESKIMPISGGGFQESYNGQASVEHDNRLIIHHHLTQHVLEDNKSLEVVVIDFMRLLKELFEDYKDCFSGS